MKKHAVKMKTFTAQAKITLHGHVTVEALSADDAMTHFKAGNFDYDPATAEPVDWDLDGDKFKEQP